MLLLGKKREWLRSCCTTSSEPLRQDGAEAAALAITIRTAMGDTSKHQQLTGAVIELIGTTLSVVGLNLQKWSFLNRETDDAGSVGNGVVCCGLRLSWRWWVGFVVFAAGQVGEALALSYADQSLLTTLTSISLVTNALIAWRFFGEPFNMCPPLMRRSRFSSEADRALLTEVREEAEAAAAIAAVAAAEEGGRRPDTLPPRSLAASGPMVVGRQSPGFGRTSGAAKQASDAQGLPGGYHARRGASCNPALDRFKMKIPSFVELLKRWDLLFVILIFSGVALAAYGAPPLPKALRNDSAAGKPDLADFVGFFDDGVSFATFAVLGAALGVALVRLNLCRPSDPRQRMLEGGWLFGSVAAITGTLSTCFSKPTVTLLKNQLAGHGQYDAAHAMPISAFFVLFFACATASLVALNMGLSRHEAVAVYSSYSVLNTALTAVSGVTLYRTYNDWNASDAVHFFGGVALSLVAVTFLLGNRHSPTPAEQERRWRARVDASLSRSRRSGALARSARYHKRAVSDEALLAPFEPSSPRPADQTALRLSSARSHFDSKDAQARRQQRDPLDGSARIGKDDSERRFGTHSGVLREGLRAAQSALLNEQ